MIFYQNIATTKFDENSIIIENKLFSVEFKALCSQWKSELAEHWKKERGSERERERYCFNNPRNDSHGEILTL
jgi:hypothetical protein